MRVIYLNTIVCLVLLLQSSSLIHACTGGVNNQGSLTPTLAYQTVATMDGYYYSMTVSCGNIYNFDFCANGGSASSLFPEITILDATGVTQYAFSPYSGGCSTLSWTATFTGSIRILITDSGCFQGQTWNGTMAYNYSTAGIIDPSFSMSQSCGGGVASITGTPGGTFSFNPVPGDGAQINSLTGTVSNGTAGNTYSVEYSICGSSSIESLTVITDDCFSLNGSATYISVSGEDCIQLTAEVNNQTGCAWNGSQVDFNSSFSLTLDYYFGNNVNGADGNTFSFQPSSSSACGQNGGQLGAGGLSNALSVEFDTYDNDNPAHVYDMSCDHVAIEIDGNMLGPGAPFCGPVCAKPGGGNIDDGGTYEVEIQWDATTHQMDVYFNGNLRLSCTSDFVNTVFGGQSLVYWGATSATGGLNNQQYFCPSTVVVLPAEMISFSSLCVGENELLQWETASENRVDYYELEYTTNGVVYYPIGKVQAVGNSTELNAYSLEFIPQDNIQKYFRIKTVDEDGNIETSELIASQGCLLPEMLSGYIFHENGLIIQSLPEAMEISLINSIGQQLRHVVTPNASMVKFSDLKLSRGIYLLNFKEQKSGRTAVYRIYY